MCFFNMVLDMLGQQESLRSLDVHQNKYQFGSLQYYHLSSQFRCCFGWLTGGFLRIHPSWPLRGGRDWRGHWRAHQRLVEAIEIDVEEWRRGGL